MEPLRRAVTLHGGRTPGCVAQGGSRMTSHPPNQAHAPHSHANGESCPHCLVPPPANRSAKFAWTVAGIAVALLLAVFFLGGARSAGGTFLAGASGLTLLAVLACPLGMGAMMWFMRKH